MRCCPNIRGGHFGFLQTHCQISFGSNSKLCSDPMLDFLRIQCQTFFGSNVRPSSDPISDSILKLGRGVHFVCGFSGMPLQFEGIQRRRQQWKDVLRSTIIVHPEAGIILHPRAVIIICACIFVHTYILNFCDGRMMDFIPTF